ncbi:hypothetical protein IAT38_004674 [Cryptococcus sp. DSM 104549]
MRLLTPRTLPLHLLRPLPTSSSLTLTRYATSNASSSRDKLTARHGLPLPPPPVVIRGKMAIADYPVTEGREEPLPYGYNPETAIDSIHPKLRAMAPNVYANGAFFASAKKLQMFIADHPKALRQDLDEARNFVFQQPSGEVNAPVWNMLLGYLGRGGDMIRLWESFNIMKKRGCTPTARTYTTMLNAYAGVAHSAMDVTVGFKRPPKVRLSQATIVYVQSQEHQAWLMKERALLEQRIRDMEEDIRVNGKPKKVRPPPTPPKVPEQKGARGKGPKPQQEIPEPTIGELKKVLADVVEQIGVSPANAYLKYLSRYGLYKQMSALFVAMPSTGPLAPDTVTYTTMLTALYFVHKAEAGNVPHPVQIGAEARSLWNQCLRQVARGGEAGESVKVDNALLSSLIKCLMRGSPADGRFAMTLVNEIWGLPPPGLAISKDKPSAVTPPSLLKFFPTSPDASTSDTPPTLADSTSSTTTDLPLPRLDIDVRSADALINSLASASLHTLATHYTHLILSDRRLTPYLDYDFFCTVILAFARTADIEAVMSIMDSYAPIKGPTRAWPAHIWHEALTAARWAGNYPAALKLFRRACHLPATLGDPGRHLRPAGSRPLPRHAPYAFSTPNGKTRDERGAMWSRPNPLEPNAHLLTLVFYTALQRGLREALSALEMFEYLGGEDKFWTYHITYPTNFRPRRGQEIRPERKLLEERPTQLLAKRPEVQWGVQLARAVERAVEKVGGERYQGLLEKAKAIGETWGKVLGTVERAKAEERTVVKETPQKLKRAGMVDAATMPKGVNVLERENAEEEEYTPPPLPSTESDASIPRSVLLDRERNKPPKNEQQFYKRITRQNEDKIGRSRGKRVWTENGQPSKRGGPGKDVYDDEEFPDFDTGPGRYLAGAGGRGRGRSARERESGREEVRQSRPKRGAKREKKFDPRGDREGRLAQRARAKSWGLTSAREAREEREPREGSARPPRFDSDAPGRSFASGEQPERAPRETWASRRSASPRDDAESGSTRGSWSPRGREVEDGEGQQREWRPRSESRAGRDGGSFGARGREEKMRRPWEGRGSRAGAGKQSDRPLVSRGRVKAEAKMTRRKLGRS